MAPNVFVYGLMQEWQPLWSNRQYTVMHQLSHFLGREATAEHENLRTCVCVCVCVCVKLAAAAMLQ